MEDEMKTKIVAVCGYAGSGKSTVVSRLSKPFIAPLYFLMTMHRGVIFQVI